MPPALYELVGLARGVVRGPARRLPFRWWLQWCWKRRESGFLFAAAAFLGVAALGALGVLDGLLAAVHREGDAAYGVAALSDTGLDPPEVGRPGEVAATWFGGQVRGYAEPRTLVLAHVALDTIVFLPAYGWLLGVGLLRLALRFESYVIGPPTRAQLHVQPLAGAFRRVAATAFAAVPLLLLVDLVENVLIAGAAVGCIAEDPWAGCDEPSLTYALWAVTSLKWLLFLAAAVPAASGLLALDLLVRGQGRELSRVLVRVRAIAVFAGAFAVAYLWTVTPFAEQAADLLRRWDDDLLDAGVALVLTAWWSALLLYAARRLVTMNPDPRPAVPLVSLLVAGIAAVVAGGLLKWLAATPGILLLGALVLGVWSLSMLVGPIDDEPPPPVRPLGDRPPAPAGKGFGSAAVPALLAALPVFVLGFALQRAALPEWAWAVRWEYAIWVGAGLALQLVAWWIFFTARGGGIEPRPVVVGASVALGIGCLFWVVADVRGFAATLGGAGVVSAFAISATALAYLLTKQLDALAPPSAIRALRLRRIPFLTLLVAWSVGVGFSDRDGGYHNVRLEPDTRAARPAERSAETLDSAFDRWLGEQEGDVTPLVFVAASGGGIRAAYWTAVVLDCIVESAGCDGEPLPPDPIFVASGVSGSSLGLAAFAAHLRQDGSERWRESLEGDMLSPTIAWALFVDAPNAFLHADWGPDRARRLEESWETGWPEAGGEPGGPLARTLFGTAIDGFPLLVLNGTAAESGCRINVSALDLNVDQRRVVGDIEDCIASRALERPDVGEPWALATTLDLNLFVCDNEDLHLSTAALLSARFPYVSPSGRLRPCRGDAASYAVDGGYFDNTGARAVVELWAALADRIARANEAGRCIVPIAVAIDNHYDEVAGPDPESRPLESLVPLKTFAGGRGAGEANARQALALAMRQPAGPVVGATLDGKPVARFVHIRPRAHPGVQAPLGWALSESSQTDLRGQLEPNKAATGTVRTWLDPDELSCDRT